MLNEDNSGYCCYRCISRVISMVIRYNPVLPLTGVRGFEMASGYSMFSYGNKVDRDILCPDVLMLEDLSKEIDIVLKPLFDSIWNACGYTKSVNFDNEGKFNPRA